MAARVAPEVDDEIAEPVDDQRFLIEPGRGMDVSDSAQPLRHAVESTELLLQRGEYPETGQTSGVVTLFDGQLVANAALHQRPGSVEGAMARDIREPPVHGYEREVELVACWSKRLGQSQTKLL